MESPITGGQVGQRIVLRDNMGRCLMSHMFFGDWGMGWTGGTGNFAEGHHWMSHMSLGIEGWDGRRVMLKDRHYGTSLQT